MIDWSRDIENEDDEGMSAEVWHLRLDSVLVQAQIENMRLDTPKLVRLIEGIEDEPDGMLSQELQRRIRLGDE